MTYTQNMSSEVLENKRLLSGLLVSEVFRKKFDSMYSYTPPTFFTSSIVLDTSQVFTFKD